MSFSRTDHTRESQSSTTPTHHPKIGTMMPPNSSSGMVSQSNQRGPDGTAPSRSNSAAAMGAGAPGRAPRGFLPVRLHCAITAETREKRVERALRDAEPCDRPQRADELDAVALSVAQERKHAELDHPSAKLGREAALTCCASYHAEHSSMRRKADR